MRRAILIVIALEAISLRAEEPIFSIGSEVAWGSGINGRAVGWSLSRPHHNVTISAHLGNGGGQAFAVAFLMRAIGPGTTARDEIAWTSLELPYPFVGWVTLFEGLELEAGDYWLVIARPPERWHNSLNWVVANPMTLSGSCGVRYLGTTGYTFMSDAAEYIPASKFGGIDQLYGFQIEVTGEDATSAAGRCYGSNR